MRDHSTSCRPPNARAFRRPAPPSNHRASRYGMKSGAAQPEARGRGTTRFAAPMKTRAERRRDSIEPVSRAERQHVRQYVGGGRFGSKIGRLIMVTLIIDRQILSVSL